MAPHRASPTVAVNTGGSYTQQTPSPFTLRSVKFESAHAPMYRSDARPNVFGHDWGYQQEGPLTTKEWTQGQGTSDPVSHSTGRPVQLKVGLTYNPARNEPVNGRLEGTPEGSDDRAFRFPPNARHFKPGMNRILMRGQEPLQDWPCRRDILIQWTIHTDDHGSFSLGKSGPHRIFVTFNAPRRAGEAEDGASVQRMREATRRVQDIDACDAPTLLQKLFAPFRGYVLSREGLSRSQNEYLDQHPEVWEYMKSVDWPRFSYISREDPLYSEDIPLF